MGGTMPDKSRRLLTLMTALLLALLVLTGCGKFGEKFPNEEPTIAITSYEGFDDSELLAPYADTEFLFQQKIFWNATDPDGIIAGFAYRVKDQSGNPIATPGNHYVDMTGDVTPQNVVDRFGVGWVIHYKTNADQNVPLDQIPNDRKTIWTSAKYAVINFPAADANGNPLTMQSTFEVIAIDNRGGITPVTTSPYPKTSMAWRRFNSTSARPTCIVTTTKGNPNGGVVGSGLRLDFTMDDADAFIDPIPYKFEFKMMKIDPADSTVIAGSETEWIDTEESLNDIRIDEYLLTRYTTPFLTYDVENGVTNTLTKIEARAYDMSGVVSEGTNNSRLIFAVKAGFRPKTVVYPQRTYALGDNHFIDYTDDSTPEIMPFTIVGGLQRFATPFFKDLNNVITAVNSNNIKVWMRWGWRGEYGIMQPSGSIWFPPVGQESPYDKKVDTVLDRDTDANYFSEITNFDLRLDGEPYNYPPFANSHVIDGDGKEWLRIPLYSPLGQTLVLTSLASGIHSLEVRCVDLQGEVDPVPATYTFTLVDAIAASERSGVLVVDDDLNNASTSPDATVLAKYEQMLSGYSGAKTFIHRTRVGVPGDTYGDYRLRHLSTTDLQQYKLVIYHSDNPSEAGNLKNENDGLSLYLRSGGNFLLSSTSKLASTLQSFVLATQRTFVNYLGVQYVDPPAKTLSDALQIRAFFQKALGESPYPNINLQYTAANEASFNPLVNNLHGLATITYFHTKGATADVIYRMGIKPTDYAVSPPTADQFTLYNNQPIALRNVTGNTHAYVFGFPLSYMVTSEAQAMMTQILTECGLI